MNYPFNYPTVTVTVFIVPLHVLIKFAGEGMKNYELQYHYR